MFAPPNERRALDGFSRRCTPIEIVVNEIDKRDANRASLLSAPMTSGRRTRCCVLHEFSPVVARAESTPTSPIDYFCLTRHRPILVQKPTAPTPRAAGGGPQAREN